VVRVTHVTILHVFPFLVPCCNVRFNFGVKTMFVFILVCYVGGKCFSCYLYLFGCPTRFVCQMMFELFDSIRRVSLVVHVLLTRPEHLSSPSFSWVRVVRSLVFCVMFCRSLFVIFLLTNVLSLLLRFTASNYTFGIFKVFLLIFCNIII